MWAWYMIDAENLIRVNADHNDIDNDIACELVQSSQMLDVIL